MFELQPAELCLPVGLSGPELERLDTLVATRKSVARGEALFHVGDAFQSLYAVRTGFFKTSVCAEDGRDQVTGFQMAGELLGLDGISHDRHAVDAIALEDSQVCIIPFGQLEALSREFNELQHQFHVMLLLGSMRAEERPAAFLLNLTQRLKARGFSGSSLILRMTREEIGSYLGLKLETVSRSFSKFQDDGLLEVKQRHIQVVDDAGLDREQRECVTGPSASAIAFPEGEPNGGSPAPFLRPGDCGARRLRQRPGRRTSGHRSKARESPTLDR